jgi:hypothetical protein
MSTDIELRVQAIELIRDINAVTGITTADQARLLNLHKVNVSATINQGRVKNLGWDSISRLLRMYGFEKSNNQIRIRNSEACPVMAPGLFDDRAKQSIGALVSRLRQLGLTCVFVTFLTSGDHTLGPLEQGGALIAYDNERTWACVSLNEHYRGELRETFDALGCCVANAAFIDVSIDVLESWADSPPHRSELLKFIERSVPLPP